MSSNTIQIYIGSFLKQEIHLNESGAWDNCDGSIFFLAIWRTWWFCVKSDLNLRLFKHSKSTFFTLWRKLSITKAGLCSTDFFWIRWMLSEWKAIPCIFGSVFEAKIMMTMHARFFHSHYLLTKLEYTRRSLLGLFYLLWSCSIVRGNILLT